MPIFISLDIVLLGVLVFRINETIHLSLDRKRLPPGQERKMVSANLVIHLVVCVFLFLAFTGLTAFLFSARWDV